ncbi:MAG TPA: AMIN domain-containing protein [Gemmatimonadales bacterium]|jgi:type IV pilus assembly protein PilQ|nr:AMIN domain-containing protein [Gemmatimonadales bacterium]
MTGLYRLMLVATVALGAATPLRAEGPGSGEVTAVSLTPAAGKTEVVVAVRGAVDVRDFLLTSPDRLVLDVVGAKLGTTTASLYDGVKRGGVLNLRYSQFRPDVVRIVIDLQGPETYTVDRSDNAIRVSFGDGQPFQAWSSTDARTDAVAAVRASDDVTEPAPVARKPEVGIRSAAMLTRADEPRITVTWDRASIGDVVAGFAAFSGRTIILGKDVKGEVNAEIKNQPWPQAFQAVLASQGLSAQEMAGGIIRVDAPSALAALDSLEPLETSIVRINYAQAASLSKTVESILTKNRGRVVADTGSNALILTDTRSKIASVTDFVRGLDVRTPQLSIQAKIIFVDRTDVEQLGLKYDLGSRTQFFNKLVQRPDPSNPGEMFDRNVNVIDLGGNSVAAVGNATAEVPNSALDLIYSTSIGGFALTTFLSALERTELADIQAEPVISTLDNRQADILVGEETPVRVIDANSSSSGTARANVQFKETGIRLTVTPHVTNNRQVLMQLHTERSAIQPLAAADLGFIFQKQKADNQLLVNDGETAVIGGLTVTQVTKTRSGIPLLGSLPIVGRLFSFTSDQENRRDLIILVTPRITDDGASEQ